MKHFWLSVENSKFTQQNEETMLPETKKHQKRTKVNHKAKNLGNDPFFIKKAKESKKFLEKHGFPEELLARK